MYTGLEITVNVWPNLALITSQIQFCLHIWLDILTVVLPAVGLSPDIVLTTRIFMHFSHDFLIIFIERIVVLKFKDF